MDEMIVRPAPVPPDEPRRLAALAALDVLDTPPEAEIDAITLLAADRFDTAIALVSLVAQGRQWFKSRVGLEACETERAVSFCAHAILSDAVMVVPDARADPRFADNPLVTGAPHIRFYAGAPLVTRDGARIGTLCVIDSAPRAGFSARDARALDMMARQVVGHLELRQLRKSERISHLIGETTSDAFVCADPDSRIIHWNRAAEAIFGWTAAEALGQPLDIIIPDRHRAAHHAGMAGVRRGVPTKLVGTTVEVPGRRRDGSEVPTELSLGMWPDEASGQPAGFTAVLRDVSARKALEAERAATEARLAEKLAAIEASNDGIAITDPDGRYIYMNSAHAAMFGFAAPAEAIGRAWHELYTPEEVRRIEEVAFAALDRDRRWRGETTGRRLDGSAVAQEVSLSLGENGGIVCVTRDIGARLEADRERELLREQLLVAQRHEAIGQLAAGIAHDFNNLLAAINGSASLIVAEGNEAARRHAERILAAGASAAGLVDKMLNLSARRREARRVDLGATVAGVCDLIKGSLPPRHRISVMAPPDPVIAVTDPTELMQVVLNLGINAREALPKDMPGSIEVGVVPYAGVLEGEIVVGEPPEGPAALIRVADTGRGIAPADAANIFRRFFTGKTDGGTGLGLAVVSGIVAAAGGAVALRSAVGQGTVFEVLWPLQEAPAAGPAALPDRAGSLAGRGVLVVDDNAAMVEVLGEMLGRAGAEVGPCVDPADALAALREDPEAWALMVTDYDMPGMNGAELARAARRLHPGLPVLLCTALPETRPGSAREAALFDGVIRKPVTLERLVWAAGQAIAAREGEAK